MDYFQISITTKGRKYRNSIFVWNLLFNCLHRFFVSGARPSTCMLACSTMQRTSAPSGQALWTWGLVFLDRNGAWSLVVGVIFHNPLLKQGTSPMTSPEMATNFSKDKQVPKICWAWNSISCHRTTNKLLRKVAEILPNQLSTGGSSSPTCATLQLGLNPMARSWISTENLEMDVKLSGKSFIFGNTTMAFLASKTCDELTTEWLRRQISHRFCLQAWFLWGWDNLLKGNTPRVTHRDWMIFWYARSSNLNEKRESPNLGLLVCGAMFPWNR